MGLVVFHRVVVAHVLVQVCQRADVPTFFAVTADASGGGGVFAVSAARQSLRRYLWTHLLVSFALIFLGEILPEIIEFRLKLVFFIIGIMLAYKIVLIRIQHGLFLILNFT